MSAELQKIVVAIEALPCVAGVWGTEIRDDHARSPLLRIDACLSNRLPTSSRLDLDVETAEIGIIEETAKRFSAVDTRLEVVVHRYREWAGKRMLGTATEFCQLVSTTAELRVLQARCSELDGDAIGADTDLFERARRRLQAERDGWRRIASVLMAAALGNDPEAWELHEYAPLEILPHPTTKPWPPTTQGVYAAVDAWWARERRRAVERVVDRSSIIQAAQRAIEQMRTVPAIPGMRNACEDLAAAVDALKICIDVVAKSGATS